MIDQRLVYGALRTIKDPELGLDLVSLGLIYDLQTTANSVSVRLTLTTPGCPLIATIIFDVRRAIRQRVNAESVTVDLTFDPPWSPDRMTEEARELLGLPIRRPVAT